MMKSQNKKRGFTIIELVIVVSVIAILSAVLIPTFAGVIKRANRSADEQAVASMNTALVAADDDVDTIAEVIDYLADEGYAVGTYKPLSKGYAIGYSAKLNKIVLINESNAVVYPKEYASCDDALPFINDKGEVSENLTNDLAATVAANGGIVTVSEALTLENAMYVTKSLTINLAANISIPTDTVGDGVFSVKKGSTLTLNGEGIVNGAGQNYYSMAVWADSGEVVINGGTYTNTDALETMGKVGPDGTDCNYDLIYVSNGGKVTINGGTFIGANPTYTLNVKDKPDAGSIEVKGGKFYKFNPAETTDATIKVAEGYKVVQDGDWFEVVAE